MNPANSPSANSSTDSQELLERGRLTLQAIQYHERAARYKAAAASLQAAMLQAENGNAAKLYEWLESESHQFATEIDFSLKSADEGTDVPSPSRSLRIDTVTPKAGAPFGIPLHAETDSSVTSPEIKSDTNIKLPPAQDLDQGASTGSAQVMTQLAPHESPWSRMEEGANERLACETIDTNDGNDSIELRHELVESENLDSQWNEAESETALISTEEFAELESLVMDSGEHRTKAWWKAPHVWGSVVVHAVLIVFLSILVVKVASEPKLLAVVSAPVESDNILLETPMEMISELELESIAEPMQSLPAPSLSGLANDISVTQASIDAGSMPSAPSSVTSALNGASSEMSHASMAGSKMLSGAEFFGVKATGNTFVYIVDSSPSMRRDGAFDAAKAEIMRSLQSMKPKQRYFISFFGKEIDPMVFKTGEVEKYPVYAKPENLTKTIEWLSRIQIQKEGLPPNNALSEAIAMQPDGIFLLFDGDTRSDVAKYLRKANRTDDILSAGKPKVPIHVVHFFQEEFQKQMRQVAEENGGTYRFVPRPERPSKK
ncbi:MAG: hypothetical protein NTY15_12110 [Planctomycetota bacterium]|nr:hypothetical protein [Planctomycetota bacterium]